MVYTYIFAIYSAFIFVKTKSILICIILHAYCNFLGAPTGLGVLFRPKKLDREYVTKFILYVGGVVAFIFECIYLIWSEYLNKLKKIYYV